MRQDEAVDKALAEAPRNSDGSVDEKWVIERAAELVDVDVDEECRRKVKAELDKRRRPGTSKGDGQLVLFGDAWPYEPDQILADDDGRIIEKSNAVPHYTAATARRSRSNLEKVLKWTHRHEAEHDGYTAWVVDQMASGRPLQDLRFDVWVKEADVWRPNNEQGGS